MPGYGKTTLAQQRATERAAVRGVPVVILDPEASLSPPGAVVLRDVPPDGLVAEIWERGNHVVYTPPRDPKCVEQFFDMVRGGGNVVLLVDECSHYARGQHASPALMHLCRTRRHGGVDLYFTSTYAGDAHSIVWTVKTSAFIFRNESAIALDRIKRETGCDDATIEVIRNLREYQYVEL